MIVKCILTITNEEADMHDMPIKEYTRKLGFNLKQT